MTAISAQEFYGNEVLETIVLPDSMTGIGKEAFKNCTALVNVNVQDAEGQMTANTLPSALQDLKVGSGVFAGCTALTQITLPNLRENHGSALQRASDMFNGCTKLTSVTIPATVKVLPERAFAYAGAEGGMTVTLETDNGGQSGLSRLLTGAFQGASIGEIDLSDCTQLAGIGDACFSYAGGEAGVKITKVILPNTAAESGLEIGKDAFNSAPIKTMNVGGGEENKVVLPDYVVSLGEGAFYGNIAMTELQISANIPRINAYTFDGCTSLTNVVQSTVNGECKIESIGDAAFHETTALSSAAFLGEMNHLKVIGDSEGAFTQSSKEDAFTGVKFLAYNETRNNNNTYGSSVFGESAIQDAILPASLRRINMYAFWNASSLDNVEWESETGKTALADGECVIDAGAFYGCASMTRFLYPQTEGRGATFDILGFAFHNCLSLTDFYAEDAEQNPSNELPKTSVLIGQGVFDSCRSLESMRICNNEAGESPEIWNWTFYGCSNLSSAELPSKLTYIPTQMFCESGLQSFPTFVGGQNNKDNSITNIGPFAFFGCEMETADLSALTSLKQMEEGAFAYVGKINNKEAVSSELSGCMVSGVITNKSCVPLKKVILPESLNHTNGMKWGDKLFMGAADLTTVAFSNEEEGTVCIPNYVKDTACGKGIFALTSVSNVQWQYTDYLADAATASQANRWSKIPTAMFFGTEVASFADACIPQEDLVAIEEMAYANTNIETLDLSGYEKVKTIGKKAFFNCYELESLKLPDNEVFTSVGSYAFAVGKNDNNSLLGISTQFVSTDGHGSALSSIDFGSATTLEDSSFAVRTKENSADVGKLGESVLTALDFGDSDVETIGLRAFIGRGALESLDLDGVVTVKESAFELCTSLCLTGTPIADSVKTIEKNAFKNNKAIGEVVFGAGIETIGNSAFTNCSTVTKVDNKNVMEEETGLTKVDFSRATKLASIGTEAFLQTPLQTFDVTNTKLQKLLTGAVSDCPFLTTVKLGESVQLVDKNAVRGCIALTTFEFYSATTVRKEAFHNVGSFEDVNGKKTTPISGKVTFTVNPVELNVGVGGTMAFPFYVNHADEKDAAAFGTIIIGYENNPDEDVYKYVKLTVCHDDDKYFKNASGEGAAENKITDPEYYEKTAEKLVYKVYNSHNVSTFGIEGLEETPVDENGEPVLVPFSVTCGFKFSSADRGTNGSSGTFSNDMTVTYKLRVMEVPYYPVFYSDQGRTKAYEDFTFNEETHQTAGETVWEVPNGNTTKKLWYKINCAVDTNWQPETANLIIESSNPAVVVAKTTNDVKEQTASSWKLTAKLTDNKAFEIKPVGAGDAVITIYPEERPNIKTTWKIKVKPDISNIKLSVPEEYKKGVKVGDKFSVLETVENCLKQKVSRADGNLANLSKISDNVITYKSDNPSVASIDANGNVTIHKVTTEKVKVTFTVTVKLSNGTTKDFRSTYDVTYPPISTDDPTVTETGETVQVTKKPTKNDPGEAVYVAPKTGAATVVIPDTMMVNGYPCKVTEVANNAFSGNTTITSVSVGKNVTKIGKKAFYKCTSLQKVTLPKKIKEIGTSAFSGCKALTTVSISSSAKLTKIGNSAFANCSSLAKITIPKKVTSIGSKAFYNCKKLKKINVKSKVVTKVGKNAFKGIYKKAVIDVPNSKKGTYKKLFKKGQGKKVKIK